MFTLAVGLLSAGACSHPEPTSGAQPPIGNVLATVDGPITDIAVDLTGNIYFSELAEGSSFDCESLLAKAPGRIAVLRGGASEPANLTEVPVPMTLAAAPDGTVFVVDGKNPDQIFRIGRGSDELTDAYERGDELSAPQAMAVDADGNLYVHRASFFGLQVATAGASVLTDAVPERASAIGEGDDGRVHALSTGLSPELQDVSPTEPNATPIPLPSFGGSVQDIVVAGGKLFVITCAIENSRPTGESHLLEYTFGTPTPTELTTEGLTNPIRMALAGETIYIADGNRILTHKVSLP